MSTAEKKRALLDYESASQKLEDPTEWADVIVM